jgi:hypothetical protein
MQEFASVPKEYQKQNIHWLRLSPDNESTGGVYLLLYTELSENSLYDYWFENLETAKIWGEKYFGVHKNDWRMREELLKEGIIVIDEK